MSVRGLLLGFLLLLVAGIVFLCARVSLQQEAPAASGWGVGTRFFLISLRLLIGWHFLIEGIDKIQSATWSSEGYLRDSTGPLAPVFRDMAGERLIAKLTVGPGNTFPDELNARWQEYLDAVISSYELEGEQVERLKAAMDQTKSKVTTWLTTRPKLVEIPSPTPPPLRVAMTMPERLKEYEKLKAKFIEIDEGERVGHDAKPFQAWWAARNAWQAWRADLARDADLLDRQMKRALRGVLVSLVLEGLSFTPRKQMEDERAKVSKEAQKIQVPREEWDKEDAAQENAEAKLLGALRAVMLDLRWRPGSFRLAHWGLADKLLELGPGEYSLDLVPGGVRPPLSRWTMLDWSDAIVKYGLVAVGVCLLAGLLTRSACLAGAGFLLLFFLAMPPLPGWPESPRAEGHYLYINKTLIEMVALLLLATTRSGRWLGLDSLWQLCQRRRQESPDAPAVVEPASSVPAGWRPAPQAPVAPVKEIPHGT
jgi:uncharacterized membrane protein YphA (DoxX/SURF4 family)